MLKKKKMLTKIAAFLMSYAVVVSHSGGSSILIIGEPQLPRKMMKESIN
jgi:hypothetical protein